jgi:hypothetical protein
VERAAQALSVLWDLYVLIVPALILLVALASPAALAQIAATPAAAAPAPDTIHSSLRSLLAGESTKVSIGPTALEFWWVSALPVSGGGPPSWSQVPEGALVGAVRVTGAFKEIRGKTIKPGVYTLRLGLQPQNGDHLGASPFREHLLLSPADVDSDPKPLGFDGTVAISKQTIGTSHPAALSLDPPVATAAPLSATTNELEHKGMVFEVKTSGGAALRFGLVLLGVIEH